MCFAWTVEGETRIDNKPTRSRAATFGKVVRDASPWRSMRSKETKNTLRRHPKHGIIIASPKFRGFISHAGEDKATIAIPLRDMLRAQGISAFVDEKDLPPGCDASEEMISAMETADIGVMILSPELCARKWPIKELLCFLTRRQKARNDSPPSAFPVIVPVFYRLSIDELYQEPRLDRKDANGKSLYRASRFYERMDDGEPEADIPTIKAALRRLRGIMGVRNDVDATNDSSYKMNEKRKVILEQARSAVLANFREQNIAADTARNCTTGNEDEFRPYFHKEHDLSDLVFNFDQKDAQDVAHSIDSELLDRILDESPGRGKLISIQGIGGVGKTSLLRGLSNWKPVKIFFKDGIHFLALGMDVKIQSMTDHLCSAVEQAGGKSMASRMRQEKDWKHILKYFRIWFAKRKCLFMVDDIWETAEISSGVIHELLNLHVSGFGSKVLYTTRNTTIASKGRCIVLRPKEPLTSASRDILTRHAGNRPDSSNVDNSRAVESILKACAGLPLFLAIAGKAIRAISLRAGGEGGSAYVVYASSICENMQSLLHKNVDSYERLSATLSLSIKLLGHRMERTYFGFEVRLTAAEMHRRLCVLQRQMRVPMTMLKNLWELDNSSQAAIVAREFEQIGLVDMEIEKGEGGFQELLRLHDSLHLFASTEAQLYGSEAKIHEMLLTRYELVNLELCEEERPTKWWSKCLEADGYIHRNLCRHLREAGHIGELIALLKTPEWIARQAEVNDVFSVDADFVLGIEASLGTKERGNAEDMRLIQLIHEALKLSAGFVMRNPKELWFQLYGRLIVHRDRYDEIAVYLSRMERKAVGFWLRSVNPFLEGAGGLTATIIPVGMPVSCMTVVEGKPLLVCGCQNGQVVIVNLQLRAREREWRADEQKILAVESAKGGTRVLTISNLGTVKFWNAETGEHLLTFVNYSDPLKSMAITRDGKRGLSVKESGRVQTWDMETGKALAEPLEENKKDIRYIIILFPGGEHVLSLGNDDKFQVWNVSSGSGIMVGKPFADDMNTITMSRIEHSLYKSSTLKEGHQTMELAVMGKFMLPPTAHWNPNKVRLGQSMIMTPHGRFIFSFLDDNKVVIPL